MTDWVRLWHDMPTDPKWRGIARRSGQRIGDVIAVFNFMMVNASANANERGRTHNMFADDIACALDIETEAVQAIFDAMMGKVWDGEGRLTGWQKRQPKREDSSAERAKRWRDERKRTQANASERPETETEYIPLDKSNGAKLDSDAVFWATAKEYLKPHTKGDPGSLISKWLREHGKEMTVAALNAAQLEKAFDPKAYVGGYFRRHGGRNAEPVIPI